MAYSVDVISTQNLLDVLKIVDVDKVFHETFHQRLISYGVLTQQQLDIMLAQSCKRCISSKSYFTDLIMMQKDHQSSLSRLISLLETEGHSEMVWKMKAKFHSFSGCYTGSISCYKCTQIVNDVRLMSLYDVCENIMFTKEMIEDFVTRELLTSMQAKIVFFKYEHMGPHVAVRYLYVLLKGHGDSGFFQFLEILSRNNFKSLVQMIMRTDSRFNRVVKTNSKQV